MPTTVFYNNYIIAEVDKDSTTLLTSDKVLINDIQVINTTPSSYALDALIGRETFQSALSGSAAFIADAAFYSRPETWTASFPNASTIGQFAFFNNTSLSTLYFPACQYVNYRAFSGCYSVQSADFPECTYIGGSAFGYCSSMSYASFPKCSYIGPYAFYRCVDMEAANFNSCYYAVGSWAFGSCFNLVSLYLNNVSSVPNLQASNAFSSTPIGGYSASAGRLGSIFVPESLVTSFKTASNWSYFSDRIVGVSNSSSSSTSIPDTLVAKFVKRWYDTGSTASCTEANHYNTLPALPLVLGNPVTHLTYQIITDSAFSAQINGTTSPMGEGPHVYLSSAAPIDIDYMGTCIYSHADDGMDWSNVSEAFSVAAGNNGNYLTIHTWCDDWDNDMCTLATVNVSSYSGEYYLLKK